jgi:hypothetical protein
VLSITTIKTIRKALPTLFHTKINFYLTPSQPQERKINSKVEEKVK